MPPTTMAVHSPQKEHLRNNVSGFVLTPWPPRLQTGNARQQAQPCPQQAGEVGGVFSQPKVPTNQARALSSLPSPGSPTPSWNLLDVN